jgi:hypothetical protein
MIHNYKKFINGEIFTKKDIIKILVDNKIECQIIDIKFYQYKKIYIRINQGGVISILKLCLHKHSITLAKNEALGYSYFNKEDDFKFNLPKYKQLNIYKKFFNDWPEKVNTSSIVIHGELLKEFYKTNNPYNWKFLAIDIQLVLLYHYRKKLVFVNKILTSKRENINNLDKKFSNYLRKIYWLRRYEQHNLTRKISKKLNLIDRFITIIFIKILK